MDLEFKSGNAVENWFYETCTIFRIGIVRLGVVQLVCCVLSACLGGVLMWLNQGNAWAGMGCWMALTVSIVHGVQNVKKKKHNLEMVDHLVIAFWSTYPVVMLFCNY